ncbi:MAG: DUF3427 domain-containing protein [Deltaproteobacteria bacterium]|nr:DUF3427 domain-containing protein [Deltaproteobacteria bacterium]
MPKVLRGWFGPDAGKSGTNFLVACEPTEDGVRLTPKTRPAETKGPERWKRYSREQIPPLFGLEFSEAIWNAGFVSTPKHLFLLVTLEKAQMLEGHKYADHFLSADAFEWQSQNRTTQASKHGQLIREHVAKGIEVELFVRAEKKIRSEAAPFLYCGPVTFESWKGEKPITVRWKLGEPVPEGMRAELGVQPAPPRAR